MKLLILSDIHSNLDALDAICEPHDELWVLGDIVNYGPEPIETLERVKATASVVVQGNHDYAVGMMMIHGRWTLSRVQNWCVCSRPTRFASEHANGGLANLIGVIMRHWRRLSVIHAAGFTLLRVSDQRKSVRCSKPGPP